MSEPTPVFIKAGGPEAVLKIDQVARVDGHIVILGWCSDPGIAIDVSQVADFHLLRFERPDVSKELSFAAGRTTGLCALIADNGQDELTLLVGETRVVIPSVSAETAEPPSVSPELAHVLFQELQRRTVGSPIWYVLRALMPETPKPASMVAGYLDHVLTTAVGTILGGWIVHDRRSVVWIEMPGGQAVSLKGAYRHDRPDVRAHDPGLNIHDPKVGFLCDLPVASGFVRLCGASRAGTFTIEARDAQFLGGALAQVAARLFEIATPRLDYATRFEAIDLPHLNRLSRQIANKAPAPEARITRFGTAPETPEISIVVPLYGRFDFMEHQLLAFTRDPDFAGRAEVIFVSDDPSLEMSLRGQAPILQKICGCPFALVDNGRNNGFAAACNLGADMARGETLVFMNSDVFPRQPGWASALAEVLKSHEDIGIVSPRLLFPDGGLQHAGMVPEWRPSLQVWSNVHPHMGFDPALDPHQQLARVPLVSGACVALRRRDFDAVHGWSTEYLIGDYEDSDLCLKLRELGLASAYAPEISLTHLERQSLPHAGESNFRAYVTLLNGLRYSRRWHHVLKEIAG